MTSSHWRWPVVRSSLPSSRIARNSTKITAAHRGGLSYGTYYRKSLQHTQAATIGSAMVCAIENDVSSKAAELPGYMCLAAQLSCGTLGLLSKAAQLGLLSKIRCSTPGGSMLSRSGGAVDGA